MPQREGIKSSREKCNLLRDSYFDIFVKESIIGNKPVNID